MHLNNLFKEFPALCQLHHNVHISVVYVSLMELDNVWVINLRQNRELFFQKLHVFLYVFLQYALYCIFNLRVRDSMSDSH